MSRDWATLRLTALDPRAANPGSRQEMTLEPEQAARFGQLEATLKAALAPDDQRRLHELAGTPLLLTGMAIVHTN